MAIKTVFSAAEKFVVDNSPGILTGLGVAGAVTTVILTGRAAWQAGMDASTQYHEALREGEPLPEHLLETGHLVKTYWRGFIPAGISGVTTITCIIAANHIGARRTAAIAAAFRLSEKLTEEYKDRVVKALGSQKEEKMRSELTKERMEKAGIPDNIIIVGSEVLFYDELSGRFFKNDMETIRKAVNDINHQVNNFFSASLTDFYEAIGLSPTSFSDEVGWNTDELLDIKFSATLLDGSRPAIGITINTSPVRGYDRVQ
jgi:hypothetical protein